MRSWRGNLLLCSWVLYVCLLIVSPERSNGKKHIVTTKVVTDVVTRPISKPFYTDDGSTEEESQEVGTREAFGESEALFHGSEPGSDAYQSRTPLLDLSDTAGTEEEAKLASTVEKILSGVMHYRLPADENMKPVEWELQNIGSRSMLKDVGDLDLMSDFDSTLFTGTGLQKKTVDEIERVVRSALWMQDSVAVLTYLLQQHENSIGSMMSRHIAQTRLALTQGDIVRLKKMVSEAEDNASPERLEMEKKEAELQKYSELLRQLLKRRYWKDDEKQLRSAKWQASYHHSRSSKDHHLKPPDPRMDMMGMASNPSSESTEDESSSSPSGSFPSTHLTGLVPEKQNGPLDNLFTGFSFSSGAKASGEEQEPPNDLDYSAHEKEQDGEGAQSGDGKERVGDHEKDGAGEAPRPARPSAGHPKAMPVPTHQPPYLKDPTHASVDSGLDSQNPHVAGQAAPTSPFLDIDLVGDTEDKD